MASLPLTGVEIPTSDDTPKGLGPQIATALGGLEAFVIPRFADASERDDMWPDAPVGSKAYVNNPGEFTSKYATGWRPDSMPGPGDTTTVTRPAIIGSAIDYGDVTNGTYLSPQDIPVPEWARLYGGRAWLTASMGGVIISGSTSPTQFVMQLGWSTDGGVSYSWSRHCQIRGQDGDTPAVQWTATDGTSTINLLGVSVVKVQVRVVGRSFGTGILGRNTNTNAIFTLTCEAPE